jgi:hypothetical protein
MNMGKFPRLAFANIALKSINGEYEDLYTHKGADIREFSDEDLEAWEISIDIKYLEFLHSLPFAAVHDSDGSLNSLQDYEPADALKMLTDLVEQYDDDLCIGIYGDTKDGKRIEVYRDQESAIELFEELESQL